jgi:hypothetical protein
VYTWVIVESDHDGLEPEDLELDRRSAPRAGITAQVRIHGEEEWAGLYETSDLSVSGAFLVSDDPPPRGSRVSLDLELDADIKVAGVDALIVHVRTEASEPSARGCGVMFLRLDKDASQTLASLVDNQLDEAP